MSVLSSKRDEGKLQVLTLAKGLTMYTMQMASKEAIFTKRTRWLTANRLMDCAMDILGNIRMANSVLVKYREDFLLRRRYQNEAHALLNKMYMILETCYDSNIAQLEGHTLSVWSEKIKDTDDKLKSWMRSDLDRYGKLK